MAPAGFVSGWQGRERARVEFLCASRHIRLTVTIPENPQAARQKWRALLLVLKAKLESVDAKIATFEQAFVGDIVLPETGKTVWETVREPIKLNYEGKPMPLLLGVDHGRP